VDAAGILPDDLAAKLKSMNTDRLGLQMITNRGVKVWPQGFKETFCTNHWRCRFFSTNENSIPREEVLAVLQKGLGNNIDIIKTENLYSFDGKYGFSLGQGQ
jgi:isocitrate dehydrogenase